MLAISYLSCLNSMKLQNLKFRLLLFIISLSFFSFSQNEYVDYRSATNPLYWKNRKPFEGYWQQDVHYKIIADVNDSTDILTGKEELTYWNNSPYDISFVYFHLYNNAQNKILLFSEVKSSRFLK